MSFSDVLKQRAKTASASNSGLSPFQQTLVSRGANAQDLIKANQERYIASLPNEITMTINPEAQQAARQFTNYKQAVQETQKQIAVAPLATAGNVSALASQVGVDKLAQYVSMDYGQLKQKQQELFSNKPVEPKHYGSWTPETTEQYLSAREQYNKDLASYNAERDLVSSLMSSKAAEYYNSALKNADFDTVSAQGSKNADNPKYRPAVAFKAMTENFDDLATDDEKKLIDYYYGISTEKGNEYWNYLSPILEQRSASKLSSAVGQIDSKTVRGLVSSALSVAGGAEQFVAGLSNTVAQATGDSRVTNGVFSLANQQNIARVAQTSKLGRLGLELLTSVVNTTPSVLIGAATGSPLLGAVIMGASASGNAYAQALQGGSSPQEAAAYGLLNGASEAGLQYVLGGIGALGEGGLSGFLKTSAGKAVASKLDDVLKAVSKSPKVLAALETAAKYVGDAGSEALEEGLQEVLDPILQQLVLNKDASVDWSQVLESALLGALSAGVFNAASVVGNYRNSVLNAAQRAVQAPTTQETANDTSIPATGEIAPETPAQPTATAQTQETENTVTNIARTLKNTGKITDKEIRTIVESDANRAVFTQETGVELPAPAGDARRAIRAYQAQINTQTQAEQTPVVAPVNAEKTVQPQTTAQSETVNPAQTATQTAVAERPIKAVYGKTGKTYTQNNDAINFTYAVVDVNDLITSNDVYGNVNPRYPAELQPRDRTRQASQLQIQQMSKTLNPELLGASATAQNGAPIIGRDGVVEGGNGRVNAIALAYQTGRARQYQQYIRENAAEYGIDTSQLPANPVLVRINNSAENRAEITKKLNQSTISSYSTTETALTDASKIGSILDDFMPNDDGIINTADNRVFIKRFIGEVASPSERNVLVTSDGWLSQTGLERVQNAIFAAVYNDANLLSRLSENLDDNSKNVIKALVNTAPNALSIKSRIESGDLYNLDLSADVVQAAKLYDELKQSDTDIEDYFSQSALMDDEYSDEAKVLAWFFAKHKRGAKAMSGFINAIYQTVEDLGSPNQMTLGGEDVGAEATKADIVESAIRTYERETGETLSVPTFERKGSTISATESERTGKQSAVDTDTFGKSVGAAKPNPKMTNDQLVQKYGAIEKGEAYRARNVKIAAESNSGPTSKFYRTAAEAQATDDTMVGKIEEMVADGTASYVKVSNAKEQQEAEARLQKDGYDTCVGYVHGLFSSDKRITIKDIALAETLYEQAIKNKDYDTASNLVADIAALGTELGQSVNALRILKKLGAPGRLATIQKIVDRLNAKYKGIKGFQKIELPQSTIDDILSQTDEKGIADATIRAYQAIAVKIPSSWIDRLNAWRYFAMLANPKTHIKNIVGNALMLPLRISKNVISTAIQQTIPQSERTTAILNRHNADDKALLDYASKDYDEVKEIITSSGKYNPSNAIMEQRRIFGSKWLEWARSANLWLLEKEDALFLKTTYRSALAGFMKARGITPENITEEQLAQGRKVAMLEAQKATFRDGSALADWIQQGSHKNAFTSLLIEGLIPFKKTPINIIKRGMDYSPLGLLKAVTQGITNMHQAKTGRSAKYTSADIIDSLASGLTGSMVMGLGMWLASLGILKGTGDDDDKKKTLDELTGSQEYSIQIGDTNITLDWASPAAMPLFVGVELYNNLFGDEQTESKTIGGTLADVYKSLANITEPVFNMSMLSGIDSAIESASYSDMGGPVTSAVLQSASNYAGQYIPTIGGAIARIVDNTRRTTSAPSTSENSGLTMFINKQLAKIPFAEGELQPYIDQWGRTEDTGNVGERLLQNLVLPGYIAESNVTSVDKQLYSLYDATKDSSILPSYAPKSFSVNNVDYDLDAEQYTKFATIRGQTAYKTLNALFGTAAYSRMTDKQKVTAIQRVYNYASDEAKSAFADFDRSDWETAAKDGKLGYTVAQVIAYRTLTADITPNYDARGNAITGTGKAKKIKALQKAGMSYADAAKFYETYLS